MTAYRVSSKGLIFAAETSLFRFPDFLQKPIGMQVALSAERYFASTSEAKYSRYGALGWPKIPYIYYIYRLGVTPLAEIPTTLQLSFSIFCRPIY
ncbi:MAG TPA: hypothetical protein DDZ80_13575 [Cyanobacteria bacterium UBA8803]|nr:hypothetical protein [Cyanobacteria bacterium UBA9273]HBL59501.1 hypothetical protein [Cyanobacteria bacterium UBA8803]